MYQFPDNCKPYSTNPGPDHSGTGSFTSANHFFAYLFPHSFSDDPHAQQPLPFSQPNNSGSIRIADCSCSDLWDDPNYSATNKPNCRSTHHPAANKPSCWSTHHSPTNKSVVGNPHDSPANTKCPYDGPNNSCSNPNPCYLATIQVPN